eukprot:scaffold1033_cov408-Prasinococcus_capsulatus_cf.AAC.18
MPWVSIVPISALRLALSCTFAKPTALIRPAMDPIESAPRGCSVKFAVAPMATPPARVAFWMSQGRNTPKQ